MKIGQGIDRTSKYKPNQRINTDNADMNKNFSDFMDQEGKQYSNELLFKLLTDIDEQGKKLAVSNNLKELRAYKALVKKFMDEALKAAILLADQFSYDRMGRSKRLKIIREIDKKLLELTQVTLEKEASQIKILDQIGEIRGLLVNLYY